MRNLGYFVGVLATAVTLTYSSYPTTAYGGDPAVDRTKERLRGARDRIERYEDSGRGHEDAKKIAGKILEKGVGIKEAGRMIDGIDRLNHKKEKDGKSFAQREGEKRQKVRAQQRKRR